MQTFNFFSLDEAKSGALKRGVAAVAMALSGLSISVAQTVAPVEKNLSVSATNAVQAVADQGAPARVQLPDLGESSSQRPPEKDYLLPALEIVAFDTILNRLNNQFIKDTNDYNVSTASMRRNLRSSWGLDSDPFTVNQVLHPYQGAMYHGFARSAGLNYWESLGYTFAGSAFWELFGETTAPSRNDQVASGIAGSFLGESMFRLANLVLEKETQLSPNWREVTAAAISPSTGFNRLAFGKRLDAIFASNNPAYYARLQVGASGTSQNTRGPTTDTKNTELLTNFSIDYGLPGKDGYKYDRPFDYFNLETGISTGGGVESVHNRGLLIGRKYEAGPYYRGIWGLYGSYDYISPQLFRVSSTALSLGTTAQWWLSHSIALEGTATTGIGYAAAGTVRPIGERDYSYGLAPQALLALRMTYGNAAALTFNAREFFVSDVAATSRGGHENIIRADASLTYRVYQRHAVAIKYLWSHRDAAIPGLSNQTQTRGTIGLYYTLLAKNGFGTVDWR